METADDMRKFAQRETSEAQGIKRYAVPSCLPAEIMTADEVARYLHCSKAHVYNAINGRIDNVSPLPALCLGRRRLVRRAALETWIGTNERGLANAMMSASPKIHAVDA